MKELVHKKLNQLQATAICGNDISSSCLYVSALTILYAGQYAWISLLIVAVVLYLFRKIYGEVVGAIPLNGGAYNVLLNTSTKRLASLAATLTVLSYMATAVISASEGMHYLHGIFETLNVTIATIVVFILFTGLAILGIGESAFVAVIIFITHLATLTLLVLASLWFVLNNGFEIFHINWATPIAYGNIKTALFLGFSAAMLGISGFESSANFVEEQEPGVFPKTLRNMWAIVSFFNPVIAILLISIIPLTEVGANKESLLAHLGQTTGGSPERARGIAVVLAVSFIIAAFIGNMKLNINSFYTFLKYMVPSLIFIGIMLNRVILIRLLIEALEYFYQPLRKMVILSNRYLQRMSVEINSQEFVFFTKGDDIAILNKVLQCVQGNETTNKLKIVYVTNNTSRNEALIKDLEVLDRAYDEIDLEYLEIQGVFGPEIINELSEKWKIPKNFMFIGSPGNKFSYRVSDLGGVRLIM